VITNPNEFRPEDHIVPARPPRDFQLWSPQPTPLLEEPRKRQPHLGYAALVLVLIVVFLSVASVVALVVAAQIRHASAHDASRIFNSLPKASILMEAITFGLTLLTAYLVFPRMWHRPFGETIGWNAFAARLNGPKLILAGVGLSVGAQALESFLTLPKEMPVDAFFKHPSDVWVIALFGTFVAPICEEIFFRGFLLRGFAIFFDWLLLPKTEEGRLWWVTTDQLTQRGMILSGVLTSGLFAGMHAAQLGFAWNAVGVLWVVGGVLTFVRLRLNSVAASSVVHATYNGFLFVIMFVLTDGFRHLDKLTNH
jgi:membrane protease YdiL (CAAX protease family)